MRVAGQQYTYEGNEKQRLTSKDETVIENLAQMISNQEQNRCPIEYTNQVSRAKIYDMKALKVPNNVRSYNGLYQE